MRKLQAGAGIAVSRQQDFTIRPRPLTHSERHPAGLAKVSAIDADVAEEPMNRAPRYVAAAFLALFTAACASGASVGQLKTNPGRYVDKSVTVRGTVTSSWGIPLVPLKMYQVDDGTGEILVVSDDDRIPSRGARVRVTGKVSEFAVFGGRSIGLHLRERDLDYDGR
jgi:hypothetical protein